MSTGTGGLFLPSSFLSVKGENDDAVHFFCQILEFISSEIRAQVQFLPQSESIKHTASVS